MAQAKRKTAAKTAKKQTSQARQRTNQRSHQKQQKQEQHSNAFFLVTMSFLAATLLVMNLVMLNA